MHRIHPAPIVEISSDDAYRADRRPVGDRPWVLVNMIASADGATRVGETSGGLGSAADKQVFGTLRAIADAILVGAGTVKAEQYGPPRTDVATRARRAAHGSAPVAAIAVVSGTLDLDLQAPLFGDAQTRPIVVTHERTDPHRRSQVGEHADVVVAGRRSVDLAVALRALRARGFRTVLCEGGPTLNGQMIGDDLVDELCLSVAPMLLAGPSPRIAVGAPVARPAELRLEHVLTEDGYLFLRYVVPRTTPRLAPPPHGPGGATPGPSHGAS